MRHSICTTVKHCALAIALTALTGCENPYVMQLKDEFGWTQARMLRDGWVKSYPVAQQPVYCYHTLADADCFTKPKIGQQDRLINFSYEGDF